MEAAGELLECVICFEDIKETTVLPCACNVSYCLRCWDRALASSFNSGDQARCPTCRGPVHVDFDADSCKLLFSRAVADSETPEDLPGEFNADELVTVMNEFHAGARSRDCPQFQAILQRAAMHRAAAERQAQRSAQKKQDMIERLAMQSIPAMTRLLQSYYSQNADAIQGYLQNTSAALSGLPTADLSNAVKALCLMPVDVPEPQTEDLARCLLETAGPRSAGIAASLLVAGNLKSPPCVCGDSLVQVTSRDRMRRMFEGRVREDMMESFLDGRRKTNILCDLCDESIGIHSLVWTCKNQNSTILHALTYDICIECFAKHACNVTLTYDVALAE